MSVSDRIKAARKASGLTQKELGVRMGVSDASIAQYESGERNPKYETLCRLANALEIKVSELLPVEAGKLPNNAVKAIVNKGETKTLRQQNPHSVAFDMLSVQDVFDNYLNDAGKQKVVTYMLDLLKVEEYCLPVETPPKDEESE